MPQFSEKSPSLALVPSEKTVYAPLACFSSYHNSSGGIFMSFFSILGLFYLFHLISQEYHLIATPRRCHLSSSANMPIQIVEDLKTLQVSK